MFLLLLCNEKGNKKCREISISINDLEDLFSQHCVAAFAPEYLSVAKQR